MSEKEILDFEALKNESKEVRAAFEELKLVWELTNQLCYDQDSTEESWHSFEKQLEPTITPPKYKWRGLKIAASIAILACVSAGMWFFGSTNVTFTSSDSIKQMHIYDLSNITLNKNSSIEVLTDEGDATREVRLSGQAKFDITKSDKPFIVHTESGTISVLGTVFDVFTSDHITTVELYEGSVAYEVDASKSILEPYNRIIDQKGEKLRIETVEKALDWQGAIQCENMPLSYILEQIKLTYDVEIDVPSRILKDAYTVSLPKDNITACLEILSDVVGKKFALINGTIVLN